MTDPIDADEFARLMAGFPAALINTPLALAVSGGPDSMALARCVKRWAQADVAAFVVDHGLRAEAAAEAAQTRKNLNQIGIGCEILRWEHAPVVRGLHEKAREARYRLLTDACRRHGIKYLLVAHHRDDQAETILMRIAKGTGIDGLGGMEKQTMRDDVAIIRPFLSVSKERLVATCRAASVPFVTDASNGNEKFARGRLRKIMPALAEEGMTVDTIVTLGARAAEARQALDHYTQSFLRQHAHPEIGGSISLDRAALRDVPHAIGLRALAACLRYVHDDTHPPEHASLSALLDAAVSEFDETTRTLYGCIASIAPQRVIVLREPAAAAEALNLRGGETVLWDKRWLVTSGDKQESQPLTIRALGIGTHDLIDRLAPGLRQQIPQGRIRATLPALWRGGEIVAIPSFSPSAVFRAAYRKQAFP